MNTKETQQVMESKIGRLTEEEKSKPYGIVELYRCVQSEGSRFGRPTIAVRTTGCTHRCFFKDGGWCDSWQTSIHPEKAQYGFNDIIKIYDENPHIKEMMLTGGSPTMWPKLVNELTHFCNERGIILTIETEGSHFLETDYPINLISLSPKFSNSLPVIGTPTPLGKITDQRMIDQHNKFRLNHSAINIPKDKTYIMPAGDSREELIKMYPIVFEMCAEHGYNMTGRDHIISYDKARFV